MMSSYYCTTCGGNNTWLEEVYFHNKKYIAYCRDCEKSFESWLAVDVLMSQREML